MPAVITRTTRLVSMPRQGFFEWVFKNIRGVFDLKINRGQLRAMNLGRADNYEGAGLRQEADIPCRPKLQSKVT